MSIYIFFFSSLVAPFSAPFLGALFDVDPFSTMQSRFLIRTVNQLLPFCIMACREAEWQNGGMAEYGELVVVSESCQDKI
jgi:hypothetical protein